MIANVATPNLANAPMTAMLTALPNATANVATTTTAASTNQSAAPSAESASAKASSNATANASAPTGNFAALQETEIEDENLDGDSFGQDVQVLWPQLRQLKLDGIPTLELPEWLRQKVNDNRPRKRIGRALVPLENPGETGQLYYKGHMDGVTGRMLYDPGASHCFMDYTWAKKNGLRIRPRPSTSLNMFQGTALGAVKWSYVANNFLLGDASYVWRFLVIHPAPTDIVLGLDFILAYKPIFDPQTLRLWATAPVTERKEKGQEKVKEKQPIMRSIKWLDPEEENGTEVTTNDASKETHLRACQVIQMGKYIPIAESEERISLLSVTADTMEEEEQLLEFQKTLPPESEEDCGKAPRSVRAS